MTSEPQRIMLAVLEEELSSITEQDYRSGKAAKTAHYVRERIQDIMAHCDEADELHALNQAAADLTKAILSPTTSQYPARASEGVQAAITLLTLVHKRDRKIGSA